MVEDGVWVVMLSRWNNGLEIWGFEGMVWVMFDERKGMIDVRVIMRERGSSLMMDDNV